MNGWKNYETWNVALWIGNDTSLYDAAQNCNDYAQFVGMLEEFGDSSEREPFNVYGTPDGVNWQNPHLDVDALDAMIREIKK